MSDTAAADPVPPNGAGGSLAYDKVAQAAALAVQDAADYQRNALSLCAAAQGRALALMLEDVASGNVGRIEQYSVIYVLALAGSIAASATASLISEQASTILKNFPRD